MRDGSGCAGATAGGHFEVPCVDALPVVRNSEPLSARTILERRFIASSVKRRPKPRSISIRLGRAIVAATLPRSVNRSLQNRYGPSSLSCTLSKFFDILEPLAASSGTDPFDVAVNQRTNWGPEEMKDIPLQHLQCVCSKPPAVDQARHSHLNNDPCGLAFKELGKLCSFDAVTSGCMTRSKKPLRIAGSIPSQSGKMNTK